MTVKIYVKKILTLLLFILPFYGNAQISRQWVATYNGQGDFNDRYTCGIADANGNICLGGSTMNPDNNRDYLVVKLNSSGTLLWTKLWGGSSQGPDEVTAITSDGSGNIYITGFYKQTNTGTDFFTIKMNSSGDTLWTASYNNGSANGYDQANDIFVDGSGNVYVTGYSDSDPTFATNYDYVAIKYSPAGQQQWLKRYNGSGNGSDRAVKVVADGSGNVYVTGRTDNGNDDDFLTVKYNSAGTQQWALPYNGGGTDRAVGMVMDGGGNVYVSGRSNNGGNDDYLTIKYNPAGSIVWQARYDYVGNDRATAMTMDTGGNIYVTGQSDSDPTAGTNYDYATVKYNTSGVQAWAGRYNGAVSQYDIPASVAVSSGGAVYVTGISDADGSVATINNMVTVSYNASSGAQNWVANYNGSAGQDDAGNIVIPATNGCIAAGYSEDAQAMRNAVAIAYGNTGSQSWLQSFNGTGDNNENIRAIAVDGSNNVYTAGYVVEKNADRNMAMLKFSSVGTLVCKTSVSGVATASTDDANAIVLDNAGNPFVAGFTDNSGESNDMVYFSANAANCDTFWTRLYNGGANGSDKIYDMVRDASGNYYITGRVDKDPTFNSNDDAFTAKINVNGSFAWSKSYNNSGVNEDRGSYIRLGSNGNSYVVGRTFNGSNYDILILCYDNAGTQLWVRTYDGSANDLPSGFSLDGSNNLYICGRSEGTTPGISDYIVLKYNSSGTQQWAKLYNGSGNGNDEAEAIAVDINGNAVVTGKSDTDPSANENMDMITIQYDAAGNQLWLHAYAGNAGTDDIPDEVAVNSLSQVYVTGHTSKGTVLNPNFDIVTYVIGSSGVQLWSDTYNGSSDSSDVPNLIYLKGNDFYVAGYSIQTGQQRNALIIKYSGTLTGVGENVIGEGVAVYPNPANDRLFIRLPFLAQREWLMHLYDETGREVLSEQLKAAEESSVDIHSLENGIYFYKIQSENQTVSAGKIVRIK